jgi:hypothetical protein
MDICSKITSNFEFFRISHEQLDFLLSLVELELTKLPIKGVKYSILSVEKLAITLRRVFKLLFGF